MVCTLPGRSVVVLSLLSLITFSERRRLEERDEIHCDGFQTKQCLDLAFEYYGLTPDELSEYGYMQQAILADSIECHYIYDVCPFYVPQIVGEKRECIDGVVEFVDENDEINYYDCRDVHLLSFLPLEELGSNNNASGADIWGYQTTDENGNVDGHYAITCQADGSSIVDITDPLNPNVLAFIVSNVDGDLRNVLWRDVKVWKNWAIVVADTGGIDDHGVQIYNLDEIIADAKQWQDIIGGQDEIYQVPEQDIVIYDQLGRCHNVYVDDNIGHLYAFGSMGKNGNNCSTGIHIIDINDPVNPTFTGCFDDALYVHDAQCVLYHGPDLDYQGREICFMFTPEVGNLTIVDVTDPDDIYEISSTTYFTASYNHQGWVTSNHEYLLLDDETDEGPLPERFPVTQNTTTTYVFDIRDLDNPDYRRPHRSHILAVDHNQYIVDNGHSYSSDDPQFRGYTFQANYEAGLRVLSIDDISNERGNLLEEVAFFDVYPWKYDSNGSLIHDEIKFFGAWSVFPYFNKLGTNPEDHVYSQTMIVQSTTTGLYVVEFAGDMDMSVSVGSGASNAFAWDGTEGIAVIVVIAILVVVLMVYMPYRVCYVNPKKKKKGVYENIIAMPESSSQYGTPGNSRDLDQKM